MALTVPMSASPGRMPALWQDRDGCIRIGQQNRFDAASTINALRDGFEEGSIPCRNAVTRLICPSDRRHGLVLNLSDQVWSAAGLPDQPGGEVDLTIVDNVITMAWLAGPEFVPIEFDGGALVQFLQRIALHARPDELGQPDTMKKAGRKLGWDWRTAQLALCAYMHAEGSFATIAEMADWLGQWFEGREGRQPAESSLRDYAREVWVAYWPNGTEN